jgi:hypothetical protein
MSACDGALASTPRPSAGDDIRAILLTCTG